MPNISAVIITYNEEKNIERCLLSLKGIVDEIVVVDSFSTDKTEEICKKHNVKFIKHKFEGHIEQKNWAITQASSPYILSLDADEALSDELRSSILKVKNNWNADGYYFNRLTNYCGKWIKHCGWYPDKKLRLWDSRKGKWAGQNPHDKYELKNDSSTRFLKGDLLHFSYYSVSGHLQQVDKFTEISSNELFKKGKNVSLVKIFVSPLVKFLRDFILKLGFLDGYFGYQISKISAFATYIKYAKLRQLHKDAANKS